MSRPRNPSGTRRPRTYVRNGKTVHDRGGRIKRRQAPKRRLNAGARRRVQRKPMLYAAGTLAGLGALDAILTGRWGGAIVLGSLAGGFLLGHLVWSHHKNRQAVKPTKPKPQKASSQPQPAVQAAPAPSNGGAPASHEEWQTLYGRRCDCANCRAKRKAEKTAGVLR